MTRAPWADIDLIVSKYLICIAALELSSFAAYYISFADSTSAEAEIILLAAYLRSLAADERDYCKLALNSTSFSKIFSISIPL